MAKQNAVAAFSVPAASVPTSPTVLPYPPPRSGSTPGYAIKKRLLKQLEIGGSSRDGRINSWVEAMKASSPTQTSICQEQMEWMANHPWALGMLEEITNAANGKKIAMFLDYDGTLSPIVEDPDRAFMSDVMRDAVRDIATCFPTAIVSGRATDKVYSFVRLPELYYAGSHGMDIKGPSAANRTDKTCKEVLFQPASGIVSEIDEVYKILMDKTKLVPGARVENNKFCLSVHFRCVDEQKWSGLAEQVESVIDMYPKLHVTKGRKVLEIRPDIKWDKGKALDFLLKALGFADREDVLPIYIGDDRTDEDAFKVLQERGQGFGILVSKVPKDTRASYYLQDPSEVMEFLRRLVDWKRQSQRKSTFPCSKGCI